MNVVKEKSLIKFSPPIEKFSHPVKRSPIHTIVIVYTFVLCTWGVGIVIDLMIASAHEEANQV